MSLRTSLIAAWRAGSRSVGARLKRRAGADALILLGVLGLVVRFVIAHYSLGTNDILSWEEFGGQIWREGVGRQYGAGHNFNHPPLIGLVVGWLHALAGRAGLRFDMVFRTPPIIADAVSGWLVHRSWRRRGAAYAAGAFALFCWNPVSILITGYHGNTDSICASLALLAAVLVEGGRAGLGGLALGASINVKLIPILLVPVLLSCARTWRRAWRFGVGLSLGLLPFVPIAWMNWDRFYANSLRYRSYPGEWGLTEIARQVGLQPRFKAPADAFTQFWVEHGASVLFALAIVLAVINARQRRFRAPTIAAAAFAGFLVLAPGWGVQYAVYIVPLLFATHLGYAVAYSAVTGLYLLFVYASLWTGSRPFYSDFWSFFDGGPAGAPYLAAIAWTVCIVILIRLLRIRDANDPRFAVPAAPAARSD